MLAVGVVGYGHWGPKLARLVAASPSCSLELIVDRSHERLQAAAGRHPGVALAPDAAAIAADPVVDAVMIATPAESHVDLAMAALRAGKHVLVEKPMALDVAGVKALLVESRAAHRVLMVDHTYVFSGPVLELRRLLAPGALGPPTAYRSTRTNTSHVVGAVGVVHDLAVHDLSILDHVVDDDPVSVAAERVVAGPGHADVVRLRVTYGSGLVAEVTVGWGAPDRSRRVVIDTSTATVLYDDLDADETLRILPNHSNGDGPPLVAPLASTTEPLDRVVDHFTHCAATGDAPLTGGLAALRIGRVLDAARRSRALGGRTMMLEPIELSA